MTSVSAKRLNPTELPDGKRHEEIEEFAVPAVLPFLMARIYRTGDNLVGPLGRDHLGSVDVTLTDAEGGGYNYLDMMGIPVHFDQPVAKPGASAANPGRKDLTLEPLPRSGFKIRERNIAHELTLYPGRVWRLTATQDQFGNRISYERNDEGLLVCVHLPDSSKIEFFNNDAGLRQGYDLVAPNGARQVIMRYDYDANHRMILAENNVGASQRYSFDDARGLTHSFDDLGHCAIHRFDDKGRVIEIDTADSYKQGKITYHDDRSQITLHHSETGSFEKLWFDDKGRHFMSANPLGAFTYREFNDQNDLVSETDANGHKTSYRTDPYGNLEAIVDAEGRETFMLWDDLGNIRVQKSPAGDAWRYEYDDLGRLRQATDPLGHVTNFRFDDAGRLTQTMRHDGLIEFREYDEFGRLSTINDFNSAQTVFAYDEFGRVTDITDPAGNTTHFTFEPSKGKDFYTPTHITRADGAETSRTFHATGMVSSVTDAEGRETQYHYGPYNVLEAITDPRGNDLRFQYDSQERLLCVTNQMGLHWTFERDIAGRVVRETDFDGRVLCYTYDLGGRVVRRDNPDGAWLEYDYDKSGLLLELRAFADVNAKPLVTTYTYDENGALATAQNADARIELCRDALGRVIAETVNGARIESDIDCCGQRAARRFDGQELTFSYDGMGGLAEWTLAGHAPLRFDRDKLGQEIRRSNGRGFELTQSWDAVGQLIHQKSGDIAERAYEWSKAYEPTVITDRHWGQKRYDYDANGQISRTTHGDGRVEGFTYTPDLNISGTGDTQQFQNWQTTAAGVVKLARGPNGEVVTLEHDVCGRVIQRTVARNGFRPKTWRFGWNAQDQMVRAECPNGDVWSYKYDPFGRRIAKACKHTKVTFIWDGDVIAREITERADCVDVVEWFFEPGSFRPLARLEGGDLAYVINDHLGTPKEVVGTEGGLRWSADHDTWGTLRTKRGMVTAPVDSGNYWVKPTSTDDNLARAYFPSPYVTYCPIRFQGQWEDDETGLYYNRFRYYDPNSGQYASFDPIRTRGGFRGHNYVEFPQRWYDPFGLSPMVTVGRWMSRTEYDAMRTTEMLQWGAGDTTFVTFPPSTSSFLPQNPCDVFVTFDVPEDSLVAAGKPDWRQIPSPNSATYKRYERLGRTPNTCCNMGFSNLNLVRDGADGC